MKHRTRPSLIVIALTASFFWNHAVSAKEVVLIEYSKPTAKIYLTPEEAADLPAEPLIPGRRSAIPQRKSELGSVIEDLNYHFQAMTGTMLEVVQVNSADQVQTPALVIGKLAEQLSAAPQPTPWQESFRLIAKNGKVLIQGETEQATRYGVYTLLSRMGCDWVMPGKEGEVIPTRQRISVETTDETQSPAFGRRRLIYRGGRAIATPEDVEKLALWQRRQRLGKAAKLKERGDGHVWSKLINGKEYKDVFAANPDMLALVRDHNGKLVRKGPQFESTNPKVIDLYIDYIRKTFEYNSWPKDYDTALPVGPADGDGFSISPETLAIAGDRMDPIMGGKETTDIIVKFANDVLEKIGDEFPNLKLGFYVYSIHGEYPALHKPHPRILPIFTPIGFSRLHGTTDPHSRSRPYYRSVVERWAALAREQGNRMEVYEYNWNLADNMLPFSRVKMWHDDLLYYKQVGVTGVALEAAKAWSINGPGDYVFAKLSWDPEQDWRALLSQYCQRSFGLAAKDLEQYYLRLIERQHTAGYEAGSYFSAPLIFNDEWMKEATKNVQSALKQKLSPNEELRVKGAAHGLEALRLYLAWHHSICSFDFSVAARHYDEMIAHYEKGLELNPQLVAREVPEYLAGMVKGTTDALHKYSTAPWRILYKIPDALPTAFDPTNSGDRLNFAGPLINDHDWIRTKTFSSTWDAQGLGFYRTGAVWYRVRFPVGKVAKNEGVGVVLGGYEDDAHVWINGHYVGNSRKFANPAVFDLTAGIIREKENILAIQIIRRSNLNENLLGGLLRPSFIFTGPKVEVSKDPNAAEYRILPGGEREKVK